MYVWDSEYESRAGKPGGKCINLVCSEIENDNLDEYNHNKFCLLDNGKCVNKACNDPSFNDKDRDCVNQFGGGICVYDYNLNRYKIQR